MKLKRLVLVLALLLVPVLVRSAPAAPFTFHMETFLSEVERLRAELDPEDADQNRRRRFLKRVANAFRKKSKSLATDAGWAAKAAKLVDRAGDDLADLVTELEDGIDSIGDSVENLVSGMESRAQALPESTRRTKALNKLAKIRTLLDEADPEDLVALARAFKKALLKRRVVAALVEKAERKAQL